MKKRRRLSEDSSNDGISLLQLIMRKFCGLVFS